jgi:hypothetical protein
MAITYTWKITNLKKADAIEGHTDVVVHARWTRTGVDDDGNEGTFQGATPLRLPDPDAENFTPFEELTEEQVIEWIKGEVMAMSGYDEHIVGQITKQINAKKNPIIDVDLLPWGVQAVGVATATPVTDTTASAVSESAPRYADGTDSGL